MTVYAIVVPKGTVVGRYKGRYVHRELADAEQHAALYPGARVVEFTR